MLIGDLESRWFCDNVFIEVYCYFIIIMIEEWYMLK